jgi:hypothetical protein
MSFSWGDSRIQKSAGCLFLPFPPLLPVFVTSIPPVLANLPDFCHADQSCWPVLAAATFFVVLLQTADAARPIKFFSAASNSFWGMLSMRQNFRAPGHVSWHCSSSCSPSPVPQPVTATLPKNQREISAKLARKIAPILGYY